MTISLNRFSEIGSAAILLAFIKSSFPEDDDENDIFYNQEKSRTTYYFTINEY